jgi:ribonuclease VapC
VIVLDSSVLVGIIRGEPDAGRLLDILDTEECAVGAPTLVETRLWGTVNRTTRSSDWLEEFVDAGSGTVIPFSRDMADVASRAFRTFGRASGHPARLNFGDRMAYAVSAVTGSPLLFKGRGFRADGRDGASGVDPVVTASDLSKRGLVAFNSCRMRRSTPGRLSRTSPLQRRITRYPYRAISLVRTASASVCIAC